MSRDEEITALNWLKETKKGYIRIATLILLSKKPRHGYEIMIEIRDRTKGFWKPTAGGMYPILKDLQNARYIQGEWDNETKRKRRIYKVTESGRTVLKRALAKENQLANSMRDLFEEYMKGVLDVDTHLEAHLDSTLSVPRPLAELFKQTNETEEDTIQRLEKQSKQIHGMIKQLQKVLKENTKRLCTLRQHADESEQDQLTSHALY